MTASVLGKRVLLTRRDRKLTQVQLAQAIGLSSNTIARLERGEVQYLRADYVARLAQLLGVTTDYLLGLRDDEADAPAGAVLVDA